jgi:hypothetical protein
MTGHSSANLDELLKIYNSSSSNLNNYYVNPNWQGGISSGSFGSSTTYTVNWTPALFLCHPSSKKRAKLTYPLFDTEIFHVDKKLAHDVLIIVDWDGNCRIEFL